MKLEVLVGLLVAVSSCVEARNLTFPDGFMFGAASAAYQVEGGWNADGKGENIWDKLIHEKPECITGKANADVADDSYHKYKEDVKALKTVGFNHYRFSISWARVLPKGDLSVINQAGINYYNNLINELIANNITPVVTMYHWDLPLHLQELGGFTSSVFVDYFGDYARLLYTKFGDRVKFWMTFNEPYSIIRGYQQECFAPGVIAPGVGEYLMIHNLLKAHARAFHIYDDEFRKTQKGKISITLDTIYLTPKTNSTADIEATETYIQFTLGWFANPIFTKEGDYPPIMKERVAKNSKAQGLYRSRLPEFGEYWVKYIRGTFDFFGLNLYTSDYVSATNLSVNNTQISFSNDMGHPVLSKDPKWPNGSIPAYRYTPVALGKMLTWVSKRYNNVPILITENGWCDYGELNDTMRIRFYVNYLASALDAVYTNNVTLMGHTAWSLIDTFEWNHGYSAKFGLYYVNHTDPERTRVAKESSKVYASIIKNRKLPEEYLDKETEVF